MACNFLCQIILLGTMILLAYNAPLRRVNEQLTLTDQTECIEYFQNSTPATICLRQTGVELYHSFMDSYTFYFPKITLDCECTCDIYQDLQMCTTDTNSRRNQCAVAQTANSTCSSVDYTGINTICKEYYRICCQMYFSIRDPDDQRLAFQLEVDYLTTNFEIHISTPQNPKKAISLAIPNRVESLIIDRDMMLVMNMTKSIVCPYNLTNRWIYFWKKMGRFYTGDRINQPDKYRLDKIGWFQKNKNNKMVRIVRQQIEKVSKMDAKNCDKQSPAYDWKLNATSYYYEGDLKSIKKETLFDDVYPGVLSVSVKDFLKQKPAFVMKAKIISPMYFKLTNESDIQFYSTTTSEGLSQALKITIVKIPIEMYDVIITDHTDARRVSSFTIDTSSAFPHTEMTTCPNDMSCKFVCIQQHNKNSKRVCSINDNIWSSEKITPTRPRPTNETIKNADNGFKTNLTTILLTITITISIMLIIIVSVKIIYCYVVKPKQMANSRRPNRKIEGSTNGIQDEDYVSVTVSQQEDAPLLQETSNADLSNHRTLEKVQQRLKKNYARMKIPQPPGIDKDVGLLIDEVFVQLEMEKCHNKNHCNRKIEPLQLEDIFKPNNEAQNVRTILVEGDPGFGKSTLVTKLAFDWAKEAKYITSLFDLALLIPLREIDEQLEDFIVEAINKDNTETALAKEELKNFCHNNKVLLLLDGYDELTSTAKKNVDSFLLSDVIASCCILVTSRKGLFTYRKAVSYSVATMLTEHEDVSEYEHWDTRVVLKGFSQQQRNEFLLHHFKIDTDTLNSKLKEWVPDDSKDLFCSPEFTYWFALMIESTKIQNIKTKTQFYKALFNSILHKTLIRERMISEGDAFDIFEDSDNDVTTSIKNEMKQVGEIVVERLISDELSFSENDIQHLLKSTLIMADIFIRSLTIIRDEKDYQLMYKTFLEFLAAYCVAIYKDEKNTEKKMQQLKKKAFMISEETLFFSFLEELTNDN